MKLFEILRALLISTSADKSYLDESERAAMKYNRYSKDDFEDDDVEEDDYYHEDRKEKG